MVDLEDLTEEKVYDPKRREFMKKVRVIVHLDWDVAGLVAATNPVTIKLKDGREFSRDCVYARGGPEEPLSTEEVRQLFRPMAKRVLSAKDIKRTEDLVLDLENMDDLTELYQLLLG